MKKSKSFWSGLAILIGTAIGAGVLGIPYVVSKTGLTIGITYILFLGFIVLLTNLYLGEIILRTKEKHQLPGYANKYLGKGGRLFMDFAIIFAVYSAIVAYIFGVGESLSFLFFGNSNNGILIGLGFSIFMSLLIWRGLKYLKKYEKWGVGIIIGLMISITIFFSNKISIENLSGVNFGFLFLPFGVVLFALLSFTALPEINLVIGKNKKLMKKILIIGALIPIVFYSLFAFVVVGFKGLETPEIATLGLGNVFVLLGILTMFTSYLALGNALQDHFLYDSYYKKKKAWFLASIIPIFIFIFIKLFDFFSFTKILSIGGVVSGGLIAILILLMVNKAKNQGNRKPEYSVPINQFIIRFLSIIFILGVIREAWIIFG